MLELSEVDRGVEVADVLGMGGMGVVLRGRCDGLPCAVKMLHPKLMSVDHLMARFIREGEAMASLSSPFIPAVYRTGTTDSGQPYIAMELLEGIDLESALRHRIAVRDSVRWVRDACEAIAVVHRAGIVHRDLKPANLFLCRLPDGGERVKLLDFGIAKLPRIQRAGKNDTAAEVVMGSLPYMSPEQIRSSAGVDFRTDIWALGVVLFELLTNQLPFEGESNLALMDVILHDPLPRLSTLFCDVPIDLFTVVRRCLEKDPEHRYASAAELAGVLKGFEALDLSIGPVLAESERKLDDRAGAARGASPPSSTVSPIERKRAEAPRVEPRRPGGCSYTS